MTQSIRKFAAIGEAMLELSQRDERMLNLNFAGDTLNVTTYLARLLKNTALQIHYVTALGVDPYSEQMLAAWRAEGIETQWVYRLAHKLPGLYLIRTEPNGERHFYFYRNASAARELFKGDYSEQLLTALSSVDYLYFSNISLAILDGYSRDCLFNILQQAKARGNTVIFDSNYRASLWPDINTVQALMQKFAPYIDIALPTFDDEQKLFGDVTLETCAQRWHQWGVPEVVIKNGAQPCLVSIVDQRSWIPANTAEQVIDTTGAGDSFNAGYLAGRIQGLSPAVSARLGHKVAAKVVSYPGAIIPVEAADWDNMLAKVSLSE